VAADVASYVSTENAVANFLRNRLHGKFRIAFDDLGLEFGCFSAFPKGGATFDAIAESATIGTVDAFDGARDTDEFGLDIFGGGVDHRVTVASNVDKRDVGRQIWIGQSACLGNVSAPRIFETGAHSMSNEQV